MSDGAAQERIGTVRGLDVARLAGRWVSEPRPALVVALLLAFAIRAPLVLPSLPYLGYIDEGHVLHPVLKLLRTGGWDPAWYMHPSLTIYLITFVVNAMRPVYLLVHGHSLLRDLPSGEFVYDLVSPPEVILAGRLVVLAASLGIVVVAMALARRLAGPRAALAAGVLAALCPALVQRGAIVIVDTVATFFVLATLLSAHRLATFIEERGPGSPSAGREAVIAGLLAGASAAAKYPAGLVVLAVLPALIGPLRQWRERGRLLLLVLGATGIGAVVGTPAFVLRTRAVLGALKEQSRVYADPSLFSTFDLRAGLFRQALQADELGLAAFAVGSAGIVFLLFKPSTRSAALAGLFFASALLLPVAVHTYQPFRYALPLVPPFLIASAVFLFPSAATTRRAVFGFMVLLVVIGSFVPGLRSTYRERGLRDSRTIFMDWLVATAHPGLRILVVKELAFLPKELERVRGTVVVAPWTETRALIEGGTFDALVYGSFHLAGALPSLPVPTGEIVRYEAWLSTLRSEARFGSVPTPVYTGMWRSNGELIQVSIRRESGALLRSDSVR